MSSGLPPVTDHFAAECASIDAGEAFFHRRREQWDVGDFAKIFGNEPDWFVRCHPIETIKACQVHGT